MKGALREDPDVIVIGEIRDQETISLAMTAADAGHLVIGTMSTLNAHKTVERIIDSYPEDEQNQILTMLADSLMAVVAQQLLVTSDGKGRVRYEILLRHSREGGSPVIAIHGFPPRGNDEARYAFANKGSQNSTKIFHSMRIKI